MSKFWGILLVATCILVACGDGNDAQPSKDLKSNTALEQLGDTYSEMAAKGQACIEGDGAACKWLGDITLETNGPSMSKNKEIKAVMTRRITAHYKRGCELDHEPACEALKSFQKSQ